MIALLVHFLLLTFLLSAGPPSRPTAVELAPSCTRPCQLPTRLDVTLRPWFAEQTEDGDADPASPLESAAAARPYLSCVALGPPSRYPSAPLVYALCALLR
jgi:hypothetical protein